MKAGDVTTNGKGKYFISNLDIPCASVNRWRQLAAIPAKARQK